MRSVIGETTLDIGPGAKIWIVAGSCPGMVVCVNVVWGVGLRVGPGVWVEERLASGQEPLRFLKVCRLRRQRDHRRQVFGG